MIDSHDKIHTQVGDLALLVSAQNKRFIILLSPDQQLQTHRGVLHHHNLIGLPWGTQVLSHLGSPFIMIQPSLADILLETKRNTQIMYPKDIGFILVNMGIGPGQHVLEAGSGSGALTTALAYAVGHHGHVTTYEVRPEMQNLARKNIERMGLADRVTFQLGDIGEGITETGADAFFLDLPNPHDYLTIVRGALKPGGFFGSILPTTNQVSLLLIALRRERFAFTEVCEILLRFYKTAHDRLRPTDRMVAHTGYLIFSRPITSPLDLESPDPAETESENGEAG
jgi:tRNA (adenine57-N1/adenine58-N1)-methyltransferase